MLCTRAQPEPSTKPPCTRTTDRAAPTRVTIAITPLLVATTIGATAACCAKRRERESLRRVTGVSPDRGIVPLSKIENAAAKRDRDRVSAIVGVELGEDALHVRLDGLFRDG